MRPLPFNGMDVARSRPRRLPRGVAAAIATGLLAAVAVVAFETLSRLNGGAVPVDRSTVVTGVVVRGTLQRSISAAGTLVPQEVHVVAATQPGVVEDVYVKPGASVARGAAIARTSNPDLDAAVVAASSAVDVARAQLRSARARARAAALTGQSAYATALAQAQVDRTNLSSLQGLNRSGYVATQTYQIATIKATESAAQAKVARVEIGVTESEQAADVAAQRAQLEQAEAQLYAKETEVAALIVRASAAGIVQSVAVDPGTRVDAGAELARVADERHLKAVLQVPEGQVQSIAIGMPVLVDAGASPVTGRISRIAPAAQNGSVAVDVAFAGALFGGARPDLNVDGTIDLETLRNVLSVARPAGVTDGETASLYRLDPGTNLARLVRVRFGRGSNDRIEVLSGLRAGDTIIVSDTSAYNGAPTLRLH
jgi:HlyD family secretion protein